MSHPRIVVRLGAGARLRLIESHVGFGAGASLTNLVSQIDLGRRRAARARPGRAGDRRNAPRSARPTCGSTTARKLAQTVATLGGGLVRNETEARIEGRGVECLLNGLYHARAASMSTT